MSRVLAFADGFTSASAPTGAGSVIETYTIANNATGGSIVTFDGSTTRTVFADFELRRSTSLGVFIQSGSLIFSYDGAWSMSFGNYMGDEMFVDTIANTEHVKLMINSSTGAVTFDSGNMSGTSYSGTLKLNIVRIV
jgi:hypothetical protein